MNSHQRRVHLRRVRRYALRVLDRLDRLVPAKSEFDESPFDVLLAMAAVEVGVPRVLKLLGASS